MLLFRPVKNYRWTLLLSSLTSVCKKITSDCPSLNNRTKPNFCWQDEQLENGWKHFRKLLITIVDKRSSGTVVRGWTSTTEDPGFILVDGEKRHFMYINKLNHSVVWALDSVLRGPRLESPTKQYYLILLMNKNQRNSNCGFSVWSSSPQATAIHH